MDRIIRLHREKRKFVRTSGTFIGILLAKSFMLCAGISGPQLTLLQRSVEEIILLQPPARANEDDYIAPQVMMILIAGHFLHVFLCRLPI